jgi:hypothetical protein
MAKASRPRNKPGERRKILMRQMNAAIARENKRETVKGRRPPEGWLRNSIKSRIEELRKLERWSFRAKHGRTDFYRYLEAVYSVQDWDDEEASERWSQWVAALFKVRTRTDTHRIRTVIDASADQNRRVKSDWSRTLVHALAKKVGKSDFLEFLRKIGGPAGFKAKMAARKKSRTKKRGW